MNFHSLTRYLKYCIIAKSRHGLHSPFVYRLADECLKKPGSLAHKLENYFGNKLVEAGKEPWEWKNSLSQHIDDETVLVFRGIHTSPVHTRSWNEIVSDKRVLLSIDLHSTGLLLFKPEFKEKQHFVLRR